MYVKAMSAPKKIDHSKSGAQSLTQKRRNRRKKVRYSNKQDDSQSVNIEAESKPLKTILHVNEGVGADQGVITACKCPDCVVKVNIETIMNDPIESKEKVKAAREAKKLAKQQAKIKKDGGIDVKQSSKIQEEDKKEESLRPNDAQNSNSSSQEQSTTIKSQESPKEQKAANSKDEVDRATTLVTTLQSSIGADLDKEQIKAERAAKKAAKHAKKKDPGSGDIDTISVVTLTPKADSEMTVRDVVETLRDIKNVAQEVKGMTAQIQALNLDKKKAEKKTTSIPKVNEAKTDGSKPNDLKPETEEGSKSKAELKAERRKKQEAQRAAKEAALQAKVVAAKPQEQNTQPGKETSKTIKEKSPKPKVPGKQSSKQQGHKVSWFRHLYNEDDKAKLNKIPINSNLHPAIIKLGVQLATRVVTGSNARCIALLDALKKMVRDYSLPARTEFGRGLETHLAASLQFLWTQRQPTASQTNAVKFFRHHLTQLPNNVDEFDAKKTLQEEIDRYIREQIDMAGEAISITVRNKISQGDNILTYGCSSLIERILAEAHLAGVQFRAVVCGAGAGAAGGGAREMSRRLSARGVSCVCVDITALSFVMRTVNKVLLSASALLANGSVLGAAGTAAVALVARSFNTPVLVACETHKFAERVQTDAFLYNEIGDPDDLIGHSDGNSPLKDWRSNPNLTPLNLTYDVTPPNLVTAVVTELAILPCTSAPVVLRFKLSEYSV